MVAIQFLQEGKSAEALKGGWGGDLTHELVGKILCLAAEVGEPMWTTALEYVSRCPNEEDIQCFIEELEDLVNIED